MDVPTAILFPGQGSQTDGAREIVARHEPELLEWVSEEIGADPFERLEEGTRFAQPAIYCASLACWTAAGRPVATHFAGHSLGELAALVAAGAIDALDGARLAVARGRLMGEAASGSPGGMLAVFAGVDAANAIAAATGTVVANDNAPTQVVLAGTKSALAHAKADARARNLRSVPLAVSGAFHSPAMEPAVAPFRDAVARVEISAPRAAVVSGVTAARLDSADQIRAALAAALFRPVRWRETLLALAADGVAQFRETGPGKALTGMVRRTLDGADVAVLEARERPQSVEVGVRA